MSQNDKETNYDKEQTIKSPYSLVGRTLTCYLTDGPLKGQTVSAMVKSKRRIYVPLPVNPFYQQAVYMVSHALTNFSEHIAIFSHCVKRTRNEHEQT